MFKFAFCPFRMMIVSYMVACGRLSSKAYPASLIVEVIGLLLPVLLLLPLLVLLQPANLAGLVEGDATRSSLSRGMLEEVDMPLTLPC